MNNAKQKQESEFLQSVVQLTGLPDKQISTLNQRNRKKHGSVRKNEYQTQDKPTIFDVLKHDLLPKFQQLLLQL